MKHVTCNHIIYICSSYVVGVYAKNEDIPLERREWRRTMIYLFARSVKIKELASLHYHLTHLD